MWFKRCSPPLEGQSGGNRASMQLQEHFGNQTRALHTEAPLEASLRMGLHTGPIALNNRCDPLATVPLPASETTAVAIRLQHLAQLGGILMSPTTLPLLKDSVEYVEHRSIYLPGHPGLTPAYRIVRLSASRASLKTASRRDE